MRDNSYSSYYGSYQQRSQSIYDDYFNSGNRKESHNRYPYIRNQFTSHLIPWEIWNDRSHKSDRLNQRLFFQNVARESLNRSTIMTDRYWLMNLGGPQEPDLQLCTYSDDGKIVSADYFIQVKHFRAPKSRLAISKYNFQKTGQNEYFKYWRRYGGNVGYAVVDPFARIVYYMSAVGKQNHDKVQKYLYNAVFDDSGICELDKSLFKQYIACLPMM